MWVQLKQTKIIDIAGTPTRFYKGDWVEVGKQTALQWITSGIAHTPNTNASGDLIDYTSGMIIKGRENTNLTNAINKTLPSLTVIYNDDYNMLFSENLFYNTSVKIRYEVIPVGFKWLEQFELLVPLADYNSTANTIGNKSDQEKTKAVIRELRVPYYDTRMIFVRRSENTKQLMTKWEEYKQEISNNQLAFLCAVYDVKPVMYPLPVSWINGQSR